MIHHSREKKQLLVLEGNIGAGKSTFLKIVGQYLGCQIVFEPHEKWQNIEGKGNLLEKFYNDAPRWAYTFQSYAFITRTLEQKKHEIKNPHSTQILERSVFSDRYCFAKNIFEEGKMSDLEWTLYKEWFSWFLEDHVTKPSGFIYLQTTPETCYKRLQKRNRTEELTVTLDYLQNLHKKHESWLVKKEAIDDYIKDVPVLILECNQEFESDKEQQEKLTEKIRTTFGVNYHQSTAKNEKSSSLSL